MEQVSRKAAVAAYKERKSAAGIYAVRCRPTGECWVGRAADLGTIENRIRFALRLGSTPHRTLQAAAKAHGDSAFTLEEVERLAEDVGPGLRDATLKNRLTFWAEKLGAEKI